MKRLILTLILILITVKAQAANHYVRSAASGTASGADWTNAYTDLPTNLTRGDTYYVAVGTYNPHTFNDTTSGTSVITVKGSTVTDHGTATGWLNSYAVGPATGNQAVWTGTTISGVIWWFSSQYYVIDGNTSAGCDPLNLCGFMLDLIHDDCISHPWPICHGIYNDDGSRHQIWKNIEEPGMGQSQTTEAHMIFGNGGIPSNGNIGYLAGSYLYAHDWGAGTPVKTVGLAGAKTDNVFDHLYIWKGFSSPASHGDSWSDCGSSVTIKFSQFWDACWGTSCITSLNAAGNACTDAGWDIYSNIFGNTNGNPYQGQSEGLGDGPINCINVGQVCNNWHIYNNTFYGFQVSCGPGDVAANCTSLNARIKNEGTGINWLVENNIWYCPSDCVNVTHILGPGGVADYNWYSTGISHTAETHEQTSSSNPFVDSSAKNLHLSSDTNAWTALASPYNTDADGNTRTSSRGAFQFNGSPPPTVTGILLGN